MTTDTGQPLTAVQVAALRQADTVVFRMQDGASTIQAVKTLSPSPRHPFEQEARVLVDCETRFRDYTKSSGDDPRSPDAYTGFAMFTSAQYAPEWLTVARLLKPGDVLRLAWARGALNSPALVERGVYGDRLQLCVWRPARNLALTFEVSSHVGPDDTARMIKLERRRALAAVA